MGLSSFYSVTQKIVKLSRYNVDKHEETLLIVKLSFSFVIGLVSVFEATSNIFEPFFPRLLQYLEIVHLSAVR